MHIYNNMYILFNVLWLCFLFVGLVPGLLHKELNKELLPPVVTLEQFNAQVCLQSCGKWLHLLPQQTLLYQPTNSTMIQGNYYCLLCTLGIIVWHQFVYFCGVLALHRNVIPYNGKLV